jgi:hypothetical protein
MSKTLDAKKQMRCGEVRKSTRPGKKVMKKVCQGGAERLIHAGDTQYGHNISPGARKNFRARHNCATASSNTPRGLACEALWTAGGSKKTTAAKGRAAK